MPEGEGEWGFAPRPTEEQEQDALLIHLLMVRQVSGIADCLRQIVFRRRDWADLSTGSVGPGASATPDRALVDYAKTELGDLSFLVRRMCRVLELDYGEVVQLGLDRDEEKRASWLERHPGGRWV